MDPAAEKEIDAAIVLPPVEDFYFTPSRASGLGAEALKNILSGCGIASEVYNLPAMKKKAAKLPLPDELTYLKPFLIEKEQGPVSFFSSYKRFGPSYTESAEIILTKNPSRVFLSCFAWAYAASTLKLAEAIKKRAPSVEIIAGGAGVTVNPDFFSASEFIDAVLTGEAEVSVPEFLGLNTGFIPFQSAPVFCAAQTGVSASKQIRFFSAVLSRGCPKNCRFCSNHLVHGRKFRKTKPADIEQFISELPSDMNIHINFEDDNLMLDSGYFFSILSIIKNRFPYAQFSAENGLDYSLIDKEKLARLIDFGFRSFNLSMASSSQFLLESENRALNLNRLESLLAEISFRSLPSTTYFICGLENETVQSVLDNLIYLHSLPTLTGISLFYPVPGLPGFPPDKMSSKPPALCAGSSAYPWNSSLSTAQLVTAFRLARFSNLLKTAEGRIPAERAGKDSAEEAYLIDKIKSCGALYTLSGGSTVRLKGLDNELVSQFLRAVT